MLFVVWTIICLSYDRLVYIINCGIEHGICKRCKIDRFAYYRRHIVHQYCWISMLLALQMLIITNAWFRLLIMLSNAMILIWIFDRANMMWGVKHRNIVTYPSWHMAGNEFIHYSLLYNVSEFRIANTMLFIAGVYCTV